MISFNNVLRSLPLGLQGLLLARCPLRANTQFVQILHRFPQLLALEITHLSTQLHKEYQLVSISAIQSLILHPPGSLQWFGLKASEIDVMKNKEDINNTENRLLRACISQLAAAAFPLRDRSLLWD